MKRFSTSSLHLFRRILFPLVSFRRTVASNFDLNSNVLKQFFNSRASSEVLQFSCNTNSFYIRSSTNHAEKPWLLIFGRNCNWSAWQYFINLSRYSITKPQPLFSTHTLMHKRVQRLEFYKSRLLVGSGSKLPCARKRFCNDWNRGTTLHSIQNIRI